MRPGPAGRTIIPTSLSDYAVGTWPEVMKWAVTASVNAPSPSRLTIAHRGARSGGIPGAALQLRTEALADEGGALAGEEPTDVVAERNGEVDARAGKLTRKLARPLGDEEALPLSVSCQRLVRRRVGAHHGGAVRLPSSADRAGRSTSAGSRSGSGRTHRGCSRRRRDRAPHLRRGRPDSRPSRHPA